MIAKPVMKCFILACLAANVAFSCGVVMAQAPAIPRHIDVLSANIIAAPRGEKLLMLLNLQPQRSELRGMSDADIQAVATETGKRQAQELLNEERYKGKFTTVDVIFAYVSSMDEYNRPNFGGMLRLGTATFAFENDKLNLKASDLRLSAFKE